MQADNNSQHSNLETNIKRGIVLYTDGSARPNPGNIGWGVHGYMFEYGNSDDVKVASVDGFLLTDKGYISTSQADKNKVTDNAVSVTPTHYFDFLGSSTIPGTNNQAEVQALCYALERIEEYKPDTIYVLTDSEYTKNGVNDWCKKWERNDWRKQDGGYVANHEWWIRLYDRVKDLIANGASITVEWVKAHNGEFGNNIADILSVIGMNYSRERVAHNTYNVNEAKGYWKSEIDKHPFINFKRIYFNSVERFNVIGHYFQADPGGGDFTIGKRIPETGFAVVRLKECDPVLEAVKQKQYEIANDFNSIIMMKLDNIYNKDIYKYIQEHGKYSLIGNSNNLNVEFPDRRPLTVEVNPTGLSLRALEHFNHLEDILNRFIDYKEIGFDNRDNNILLNSHDITDHFFTREEKLVKKESISKYTLRPEFGVGFRDTFIDIEEDYNGVSHSFKVPLILGTDLLPRNNLKKLEDHKPTIHLITWRESSNSLRYATIIECESGIGLWSNFFADRLFFQQK